MKFRRNRTSRHDFIKTATVAAGAAGALSACGQAPSEKDSETQPAYEDRGLPLSVAGYRVPRVEALADGRVPIDELFHPTSLEFAE